MTRARSDTAKRRVAAALFAAGILLGAGSAPDPAAAQDNAAQPSLPPSMEERFEAPIGHRQPTAVDVPEGVQREEGAASQNERDMDKKLNICRGC